MSIFHDSAGLVSASRNSRARFGAALNIFLREGPSYHRRSFPLPASPSSTNRRSASEREGLSGWRLAHASTSAVNAGGARKASIGSLPVLGRPRFLGITFLLDTLATAGYYLNLRADEKRQTSHRP